MTATAATTGKQQRSATARGTRMTVPTVWQLDDPPTPTDQKVSRRWLTLAGRQLPIWMYPQVQVAKKCDFRAVMGEFVLRMHDELYP